MTRLHYPYAIIVVGGLLPGKVLSLQRTEKAAREALGAWWINTVAAVRLEAKATVGDTISVRPDQVIATTETHHGNA